MCLYFHIFLYYLFQILFLLHLSIQIKRNKSAFECYRVKYKYFVIYAKENVTSINHLLYSILNLMYRRQKYLTLAEFINYITLFESK